MGLKNLSGEAINSRFRVQGLKKNGVFFQAGRLRPGFFVGLLNYLTVKSKIRNPKGARISV